MSFHEVAKPHLLALWSHHPQAPHMLPGAGQSSGGTAWVGLHVGTSYRRRGYNAMGLRPQLRKFGSNEHLPRCTKKYKELERERERGHPQARKQSSSGGNKGGDSKPCPMFENHSCRRYSLGTGRQDNKPMLCHFGKSLLCPTLCSSTSTEWVWGLNKWYKVFSTVCSMNWRSEITNSNTFQKTVFWNMALLVLWQRRI